MRNTFKKLFVTLICVVLAVSLMAVGVFADSRSSKVQRSDRQGGPGMRQSGLGNGREDDVILSNIKEKIAVLEDKDTQANLTKLLEAYEDALEAEKAAIEAASSATQDALSTQRKATADARSALTSALSKAGINIINQRGNQGNRSQQADGSRGRRNGFIFQTLDAGAIEKLIAGLNDNDKQVDLTELLKAYKDALAAEKTGMNNTALTQDQKKALNEAVVTAADKLTDALTDAGIKQSDYNLRTRNNGGSVPEVPSEQTGSISAVDSPNSGATKTGILQGFIDWLGSWKK